MELVLPKKRKTSYKLDMFPQLVEEEDKEDH